MSADFSTLVNSNMLFLLYSCSSFIFEIFVIFINLFAYSFVCVRVCAMAHFWRLEDNVQRSLLPSIIRVQQMELWFSAGVLHWAIFLVPGLIAKITADKTGEAGIGNWTNLFGICSSKVFQRVMCCCTHSLLESCFTGRGHVRLNQWI